MEVKAFFSSVPSFVTETETPSFVSAPSEMSKSRFKSFNSKLFTCNRRRHRSKLTPLIALAGGSDPVCYFFASRRTPAEPWRRTALPAGTRHECFRLGVLADVQYARLPTRRSVSTVKMSSGRLVHVKRRRAWLESLNKLRDACREFDRIEVDLAVNLGDIIEGYGVDDVDAVHATTDLRAVMRVFSMLRTPLCHVIGNHCRAVPKNTLLAALHLMRHTYYAREPAPGWRLIFLDTSQLSPSAVDAPYEDTDTMRQIIAAERRPLHDYHGALATDQLKWLQGQLDAAVKEHQKVIILSHYPLADGAARPSHVVANTIAIRRIIERDSTPVVLCLAGHDHLGKFHCF